MERVCREIITCFDETHEQMLEAGEVTTFLKHALNAPVTVHHDPTSCVPITRRLVDSVLRFGATHVGASTSASGAKAATARGKQAIGARELYKYLQSCRNWRQMLQNLGYNHEF